MTHNHMIQLLADHALTPTENTEVDCNTSDRLLVENTSFYSEFGKRATYSLKATLVWLGY